MKNREQKLAIVPDADKRERKITSKAIIELGQPNQDTQRIQRSGKLEEYTPPKEASQRVPHEEEATIIEK